ncbi:MAG: flagellar protein FlgN [Acidobacteria bacterium]|nr:flagellar protein FlgN [Acidobacteriota bacterium]
MDKLLSDVLRILREEVGLYRALIEHARRKTALLVQGHTEEILESNKTEETFNLKLRILENEMSRLCHELCQIIKIPHEEFTLLRLADGVNQPVAAEIKIQANLFKHLVDELKSVNCRNSRLIESSVRYSRGLLNLLCGSTGSYQHDGLFRPAHAVQTTLSRRA